MHLGWIDFSKDDRAKVLDVIHLLQEGGAVDELGIGIIRDAFSDYFFPGTSTIQTRAKYFLIVPYVLKEAVNRRNLTDVDSLLRWIDEEEKECGKLLLKTEHWGVIGENVLQTNHWVARAPSAIYWNGLRRLGIFKDRDLSMREYLHLALKQRLVKQERNLGNRNDSEDEDRDDQDAGDGNSFQFWSLSNVYKKNWRDNLTIELLPEEASYLRQQIETEVSGSLYAYLLKHNFAVDECDSFAALTAALSEKEDLDPELLHMMKLANDVSNLIYLAYIRYNCMYSEGENKDAVSEWERYKDDLQRMASVDLKEIYAKLKIRDANLKKFLINLQTLFLEGKIEEADQLIINREIRKKDKDRAKLCHIGERRSNNWVGSERLDFRYNSAKRIITDVYRGENNSANNNVNQSKERSNV